MADAIVQHFKPGLGSTHPITAIELIPSNKGVFDVEVDEELIFSKHHAGRHAENEEILSAIARFLN